MINFLHQKLGFKGLLKISIKKYFCRRKLKKIDEKKKDLRIIFIQHWRKVFQHKKLFGNFLDVVEEQGRKRPQILIKSNKRGTFVERKRDREREKKERERKRQFWDTLHGLPIIHSKD